MCGIAGVLDLGAGSGALGAVDPMTAAVVHRGPDEEGFYRGDGVALGVRRLSIIDLETGSQPLTNEDETVWVVGNGEIYNYVELRRDLERRHTFRSHSDIETLVHLYEEHGPELVTRLRGMFAFALWDARERRLLLARDRLGKKPLYYAVEQGRLLFGSEIKAVLAARAFAPTLDPTAIYQYLCFGFVPHPRTAYAEIRALPPAHTLEVQADGRTTLRRYWRLPSAAAEPPRREEALERTRELLQESVRLRLRSDVPVGVFLSGGIDSGLVTAAASRASAEPLQTFSIGFADAQYNELPHARLVAEQYGTRHTEIPIDLAAEVRRPEELLGRLVRAYDQPFADSSAIPSTIVAGEARKALKVVLNGDGGDETFAGYRRYSAALLARWMTHTLGPVAPLAARMAPAPRQRRGAIGFTLRLLEGVALAPRERYLRWSGLFTDAEARQLCQPELVEGVEQSARAVVDARVEQCLAWGVREPAALMMAVDATHVLPDDFLVKMDIATMASSVEGRSPLLDHVLVEYAASLPDRTRASAFQTKPLLRELAREWLPPQISRAPKRGFEVPMAAWLRHELRPFLRETLLTPDARLNALVRPEVVRRLVAEHDAERRDHASRLWALLFLECWL
ncbi:MAG: asparagine synthase (glutamine-hydrolyzing), partial [Chloroflexi bacterium]|nr:asparagine synthase (glutamine-hydrolyzing) [Chloroflexota bacterium]